MKYQLMPQVKLVRVEFERFIERDPEFEKHFCGRMELVAQPPEGSDGAPAWIGVVCSVREWETFLIDAIGKLSADSSNRMAQASARELMWELTHFRGLVVSWASGAFYLPMRDPNNIIQ